MLKAGIDQEAIATMFSQATAQQGEALRVAVREATLKGLQARELTMENVRKVLKSVTTAATAGAAQNASSPVDLEAMLTSAFTGMDGALLQAVEAHRKALQQFVSQGASLRETQLKGALAGIEKMEDTFFATVTKAVQAAGGGSMQTPWDHVLSAVKLKGTGTGAQATQSLEQLLAQAQSTLRDGRAAGTKTAQAMLDGYAAMVSGVLIGMSEGLQPAPSAGAPKSRSGA